MQLFKQTFTYRFSWKGLSKKNKEGLNMKTIRLWISEKKGRKWNQRKSKGAAAAATAAAVNINLM